MEPTTLGEKYNKIAQWWHDRHNQSNYGVDQLARALKYSTGGSKALDVGCGAGGRLIKSLESKGFSVTGIDVASEMITLAKSNHPNHTFINADICQWQSNERFDFILAWDSLFHLPLHQQVPVLNKLCNMLGPGGVLIYTFGNDQDEHTDQWHDETFYYSSVGINQNMKTLLNNGLTPLHLELDQHPEKHVYVIATKL